MSVSPLDLVSAAPWERAVFTTYALSLSFFEAVILDGLIRAGGREALILSDVQGIKMALGEHGARRVGKDYGVEPISVKGGIFHSKICVLSTDQDCHVLVGSGNLTFGGWGQNLEVVEHLHPSFAAQAIDDIADFFETLAIIDRISHGVADECEKISTSLRSSTKGSPRNGDLRVVHNLDSSISDQLIAAADELGGATRIIVASPFWDNGFAIDNLCQRLGVDEVLVHSHDAGTVRGQAGANWPASASTNVRPVRLDILDESAVRPLHAKVFEVVCNRGRLVLSGSANATKAALEKNINVETCVLRIQRDTTTGWSFEIANAPELNLDPEELDDESVEEVGVLRALLDGDRVVGQIFSPAMNGEVSIWQMTSVGPEKLGNTILHSDGRFSINAPSLELRGWLSDRMILRVESGDGKISEGFISIAAFREVTSRAGAIAPRLFALLSGSETPADVVAIMTWFQENPAALAGAGFREVNGGSAADKEGVENDQLILVEHLNRAHAIPVAFSPTEGLEAPTTSWRRFMDHVLNAFREPRGPVGGTPSGRIGEDDEDENENNISRVNEPIFEPQFEQAFEVFEKLLDQLLDSANASRRGETAFVLCQYLCDRLQPERERVRTWLNKIIRAICNADPPEHLIGDISAAILVDASGAYEKNRARLARQMLIRLGYKSFDEQPSMDRVQGFMKLLPPLIPYDELWNEIRVVLTISEQRLSYLSALKQGEDRPEDYPDLPEITKDRWPIIEQAITDSNAKNGILFLDEMDTTCPQCHLMLTVAEAQKLKGIGIAKATNCCQKILVFTGEN